MREFDDQVIKYLFYSKYIHIKLKNFCLLVLIYNNVSFYNKFNIKMRDSIFWG